METKQVHTVEICNGIRLADGDIVNPDEFIGAGEYNPHNVHLFVVHDHGFVVGAAFASSLQDAFDALVDANKLDAFLITEGDYDEYGVSTNNPTCAFLGNASEPFDIEALDCVEVPNPTMSICALIAASRA